MQLAEAPLPPLLSASSVVFLPEICRTKEFVFGTDHELRQHATNRTLVGELTDALGVWLSYCADVIEECRAHLRTVDTAQGLHLPRLHQTTRALRVKAAFWQQLETDEATALLSVLRHAAAESGPRAHPPSSHRSTSSAGNRESPVPPVAPTTSSAAATSVVPPRAMSELGAQLRKLAEAKETLARFTGDFAATEDLLEGVAELVTKMTHVEADTVDALAPLFSGLRAVWVCDPVHGRTHPTRFASILRGVGHLVDGLLVLDVSTLLASVAQGKVQHRRAQRILVDAQRLLVGFQTSYCDLLEAVAVLGQGDIPDELRLSVHGQDWQFTRLVLLLEALDAMQANDHLRNTAVFQPFEQDLLSSSGLTTADLLEAIDRLRRATLTKPKHIVARIEARAAALAEAVRPVAVAETPFCKLAVTFSFDPPAMSLSGAAQPEATLRSLEPLFADAFPVRRVGAAAASTIVAPASPSSLSTTATSGLPLSPSSGMNAESAVQVREGVKPAGLLEEVRQGIEMRLPPYSSTEAQRVSAMVAIVDRLELEGWHVLDTLAFRDAVDDVQRTVVILDKTTPPTDDPYPA